MSKVNMSAVLGKVRVFQKSDEGMDRINEYIGLCITDGRAVTEGGSKIVTLDAMKRAAEVMIEKLKTVASTRKLPAAVLDHFNSLRFSDPVYIKDSSKFKIDIYFSDDLSRMSLRIASGKNKGEYTGDGIENIVSLFDTGMDADTTVFGIWNGHESAGVVAGLTHRDEMHFMRDAVSEFNREYGELYNVYAYISAQDTEMYVR